MLAFAILAGVVALALLLPAGASSAAGDTANLTLTITDTPDPVNEGEIVEYEITVRNLGPDRATGGQIEATLPVQAEFISASAGCHVNGRTVTCAVGTLSAGSGYQQGNSAVVRIRVRPRVRPHTSNGTYQMSLSAEVDSIENDPSPANASETEVTTVRFTGTRPPRNPRCDGRQSNLAGTDGANRLVGTARPDRANGLGGNDTIIGRGSRDALCGDSGNDKINGGPGVDDLFGNSGNDRLYGSYGVDSLFGDVGQDLLFGGRHSDRLYGREGRDVLRGGRGADRLNGGPGRDVCFIERRRDRYLSCERKVFI